jgi:hypothetical protein
MACAAPSWSAAGGERVLRRRFLLLSRNCRLLAADEGYDVIGSRIQADGTDALEPADLPAPGRLFHRLADC